MIRVYTSTCTLQTPARILSCGCRLAAGAASAVRVRIARASGGATEIPRAALAAARLREDMLRGGDRRLPVLSANTRAQQLGLVERCSKERVI